MQGKNILVGKWKQGFTTKETSKLKPESKDNSADRMRNACHHEADSRMLTKCTPSSFSLLSGCMNMSSWCRCFGQKVNGRMHSSRRLHVSQCSNVREQQDGHDEVLLLLIHLTPDREYTSVG